MNNILELQSIKRDFYLNKNKVEILKGVSLDIHEKEMVALLGHSGSGKSTLLQIAGLLDSAYQGKVLLMGQNVHDLSDKKRSLARLNNIGFVYQAHLLLPDFTALENVAIPQLIKGCPKKESFEKAALMLKKVKMDHRLNHKSGQLSGGEQQRVAIARALINQPKLLLADEPTGNLDSKTAGFVFELLLSLVKENGLSALIATHNPELANQMDRPIHLQDGVIK